MEATTRKIDVPTEDDLVIQVHGTYAADTSDSGNAWWQCGSRSAGQLAKKLPRNVRLAKTGEVFHWSGANSERARIRAGQRLLERLEALESQDRSYHLIGHSHGGSVIWHTLRQAALQQVELNHLRSWATVGTPFLKHRTRGAWHLSNLVNLILALALLRPILFALRRLATLRSPDSSALIDKAQGPALTRAIRPAALWLLDMLGVSVQETSQGIRVGTFDPASGQSLIGYLFFSLEGLMIMGVILLATYVLVNLAIFFVSPVLESLRIRQETRLEMRVMDKYQGRWLGLWSTADEAINGLKMTLEMSVSFVHRMSHQESVFFSDRLLWVSRPYHWILIPFYNVAVRPMLDGVIRSHIVKTALGNNRPAAEVIAVSPVPGQPDERSDLSPLPEWLTQQLTETANHHARNIAPQLRTLLAGPSFVGGLEAFGNAISGRELVHTSYFDHAEILTLLAVHIAWARGDKVQLATWQATEPSLTGWLHNFKTQVGEPILASLPPLPLITPRRAA